MLKIGITGGIGSGKSHVSRFLMKHGFNVVIMDDVAKKYIKKNKDIFIKEFGDDFYINEKRNVDFILNTIFTDKIKYEKIQNMTREMSIDFLNSYIEKNNINDVLFVESATIFESKFQNYFDIIILVYCESDERKRRALARNTMSLNTLNIRIMRLRRLGRVSK